MKKDSCQGLANGAEPNAPSWWYHCRQHPERGLLWYNDTHYQSDHGGAEANCLRVSCKGPGCKTCEDNMHASSAGNSALTAAGILPKKAPTPAAEQ